METWVIVDDSDRAINYTGAWAWTTSSISSLGTVVGFDNTAHATMSADSESPASFTYSFQGSKLAIYGIAATFNRSIQVPGPTMPTWECIVDGTVRLANNNPYGVYPWHSYCETDTLPDGSHSVEFRVTQAGVGLWFDALRYVPSPADTTNTNVSVWIDSTDTRLRYRDDWEAIGTGYMTTKEDAPQLLTTPALSMEYNGSTVSWYALSKASVEKTRPDLPALTMGNTTTTSGFYQVDNGPHIPFVVDLSAQPVTRELNPYNTLLFRTHATVPGPHVLAVFYDGNSTVWPLTLDYITIENSLVGATASAPVTAAGSPGGGSGGAGGSSRTGVIAGATVGVVAGLVVLLVGLFVMRKYRLRQQKRYRQSRVLQLANSNIKLQPFSGSRTVDPVAEKDAQTAGKYPFAPENANLKAPTGSDV